MITNPAYGGAYAYGRTGTTVRYDGTGAHPASRRKPRGEWLALRPGTHEGYVDWERAEAIRGMVSDNAPASRHHGAAKHGDALLAGLLRCRRCGRKLTVRYTGAGHAIPRYSCCRGHLDNGEPRCIAFGGLRVDDAIEAALLKVLEPAAVAAALEAETQLGHQRDQVREALLRDLQAAQYVVERAARQYDAIDSANRLVAAELETRWNGALQRAAEMEAKVAAPDASAPARHAVTPGSLVGLAEDLRAVWRAPTTDARLGKRIVRTVVQEVVADLDEVAGEIELLIHWAGGVHTELRLPRRRRGQRNATSPDIIAAVRHLVLIASDDLIAGLLNRNGLRTGHGNRWTRERVTALRSHHRIPVHQPAPEQSAPWLNLTRAAALLHISPKTLRLAAEAGRIDAVHPLPDGPWIFSRATLQEPAAMDIVNQARSNPNHPTGSPPDQPTLPFSTT